jgi:hypothetical protein
MLDRVQPTLRDAVGAVVLAVVLTVLVVLVVAMALPGPA